MSMSKISDQNILLRAQLTAAAATTSDGQQFQNEISDQSARVSELEQQLKSMMNEKSHQDTRINFYEAENARLLTEIEQFKKINENVSTLRSEKSEFDSKIEKMNKDQEDLLELLADQDNKLKEYKKRLKNLGQPISDDEED